MVAAADLQAISSRGWGFEPAILNVPETSRFVPGTVYTKAVKANFTGIKFLQGMVLYMIYTYHSVAIGWVGYIR
jgi:hypothetical protein